MSRCPVGGKPEWGPLKHEIQDSGPSGWGSRAPLAESKGCVCYALEPQVQFPPGLPRSGRYLLAAAWLLSSVVQG